MAQTILIKRSNTSNAIPSTSQLSLGELALNTADAKLYMRKYVDGTNANDTITLVGDNSTIAATTLTGNLSMGDNIRARFGDSNDLQIYHNATNSIIADTGAGFLSLQSNGTEIALYDAANNANMGRFITGGAVNLFYNGDTKFQTTNTGINVTGTVTANSGGGSASLGSHLDLGDNQKARFGAGDDLQIYHSGTESIIADTGAGHLYIRGQNLLLQNADGSKAYFSGIGDIATLYHGTAAKLATTSTGIDVTGSVVADGLTTSGTLTQFSTYNSASTLLGINIVSDAGSTSYTHPYLDFRRWTGSGTDHYTASIEVAPANADANAIVFMSDTKSTNTKATTERMRITSAGNVGIGTTAPAFKLHAYHPTSNLVSRFESGDGQVWIELHDSNSGSYGALLGHEHATDDLFKVANAAVHTKFVIKNDGNVGIGTTAPSNRLHITSGTVNTAVARFTGANNDRGLVISTAVSGITNDSIINYDAVSTNSVGQHAFKTDGTERVRITSGGILLVGTTSTTPGFSTTNGHAFHVGDASHMSRDGGVALVVNRGTSDGGILQFRKSGTYIGGIESRAGVVTTLLLNPASGNGAGISGGTKCIVPADEAGIIDNDISLGISTHRFKNLYLSANASFGAHISPHGDNTYVNMLGSNRIQFLTNGTEAARIDASGNIGIGTSSPDSKLTIYNAATGITGLVKLWTNTSNNTAADGGAIEWVGSGDKTAIGSKIAATRVEGGGKMDMRFYTGRNSDSDYEKMRILVNGNVGIGSTAPSSKLHVAGGSATIPTLSSSFPLTISNNGNSGLNIISSGTTNAGQINFGDSGDADAGRIRYDHSDNSMRFSVNATEYMRLGSIGRLAINSTALTADGLTIGTSNNNCEIDLTHTSAKRYRLNSLANGKFQIENKTDSTVPISIATNNAITINSAFTFPTADGSANQLLKTDGSGNMSWVTVSGAGTPTYIADADNNTKIQVEESADENKIRFDTAGSERMIIDATGNVGIGETTPLGKLHIRSADAGSITANANHNDLIIEGSSNTGINIFSGTSSYQYLAFGDSGGANQGYVRYSHASDQMVLRAGGTDTVHINGGKVGIGTTAPIAPLTINNNLASASMGTNIFVKSDTAQWVAGDPHVYNAVPDGILVTADSSRTDGPDKMGLVLYNDNNTAGGFSPMLLFAKRETGSTPYRAAMAGIYAKAPLGTGNSDSWIDGQLHFATAGASSQGIKSRMVIDKEGNVGIGTTSPSTNYTKQVHIHSTSTGSSLHLTDNISGAGNGDGFELITHNGSAYVWQRESNNLMFGTAAQERMRLDASGRLLLNATSTAFSDKLYVNGDAYVTGGWRIGTGATYTGKIYNSSGIMSIETDSNRDIQFGDSGTPAIMYIDTSTENVGIGTTSPAKGLHLESDSVEATRSLRLAYDSSYYFDLKQKGAGGIQYNAHNATSGGHRFDIDGSEKFRIAYNGNVGIGTSAPSALLHLKSTANAAGPSLIFENTNNAQSMNIDYWNNGGAVQSRIQYAEGPASWNFIPNVSSSASALYIAYDGKVGIGTTAPAVNLHIKDPSGEAGLVIQAGSNTDSSTITFGDSVDVSRGSIEYTSTDDIVFSNNNLTERLRIRYTGNVGIGTSSPNARLEVKSDGSSATGAEIRLQHANNNTTDVVSTVNFANNAGSIAMIQAGTALANNTGYINFFTDISGTSAERMRIHTNGNISIGANTSPVYKLVVSNGNAAGIEFGPEYATDANLIQHYDRTASQYMDVNHIAQNHRFSRGASEWMRITSTGNVGIGTTTPQSKLDVKLGNNETASIGGTISSGTYAGLRFGYSEAGNTNYRHSAIVFERDDAAFGDARGNIHILNSPSGSASADLGDARLTILPSGNVGIGTTTPAAQLQVKQLGINVNQSSVASTNQYTCDSMSATIFRSARYTIQITNTTDGTYHLTEMLLIHDGTTPSINEFGTIFTGSAAEAVFTADINSGNVRLLATPASSDAMQFKVVRHSILV